MGRTSRNRRRRKNENKSISLDFGNEVIALTKWMKSNGWTNSTKLQLRNFKATGRGVSSKFNMNSSDVLIEVPFELMISLRTLEKCGFIKDLCRNKMKMEELLAIYLLLERHKGPDSEWYSYINSLPINPPDLPCASYSPEESEEAFEGDLREEVLRYNRILETSWENVKKSIHPSGRCVCCGKTWDCVLTRNSFTWAFIMVNTRSVYVDPTAIGGDHSLDFLLSDDPSVALCPFVDMFNHSDKANTLAELIVAGDGSRSYKLVTKERISKHEQIFILYNGYNNIKLFCQYGFHVPFNSFDYVTITFKEILETLRSYNLQLSEKQYKFIKEKALDKELHVSLSNISFNLKALIFIILNSDQKNWNVVIYTESYTNLQLVEMISLIMKILQKKITSEKTHLLHTENAIDYVNYRNTYRSAVIEYLNSQVNQLVNK